MSRNSDASSDLIRRCRESNEYKVPAASQVRWRAFQKALELLAEAQEKTRKEQAALAADFQRELAELDADWERTFGEPCPQTIEDLERWAARLGLDPNWIVKGHWTEATILPLIEGELQRLRDQRAGVGQSAGAAGQAPPIAGSLEALPDDALLTHVQLAAALDLQPEALRSRLSRWRRNHLDGWQEVVNPEARQPRYVYRVAAIRPLLRDVLRGRKPAQ